MGGWVGPRAGLYFWRSGKSRVPRAGLQGWGSRAGGWVAPTYKGRYDVTGIIGSTTLMNSGFHTRRNFPENYPKFGHAVRNVRQPYPRSKKFLRIRACRDSKLSVCPGRRHVSGRPSLLLPGFESRTVASLLQLRKVEILKYQWCSVARSGLRGTDMCDRQRGCCLSTPVPSERHDYYHFAVVRFSTDDFAFRLHNKQTFRKKLQTASQ
jgi:hypothetical protein